MFIYNVKINSRFLLKVFFAVIAIIAISIFLIAAYKIFKGDSEEMLKYTDDEIPAPDVAVIDEKNYTNILKQVHDDLNTYLGQKISFTGYVYRVKDIKEDEFILARDMVINSKMQTVVVGFLCHFENAKSFADGSWVKINGTISKGDYYGEIPLLEITEIEGISKPENEYVYPPDDTFVPTAVIY